VVKALSFFLGKTQDFPSSLSELVKSISIVHSWVIPLSAVTGSRTGKTQQSADIAS
jgi:hypothetical protein